MTATPRTRFSRYLFQAEFLDGLDYQGRIVARTGEIATYDRGGTVGAASGVDSNGNIYIPGYKTPRFHHQYNATTGLFEPVGLLLDPSRVNQLLYSQALDTGASWSLQSATISANAATAPDGTTTADKLVEAAVTDAHNVHQVPASAPSDNTLATLSAFVKVSDTRTFCQLVIARKDGTYARAWFNLSTGATATLNASAAASGIVKLINGWYRVWMSADVLSGGSTVTGYICVASADNTDSYAGDITKGLYVWGAQFENAAFASSYIPTTSAAVTRSADALSFAFNAVPQALSVYVDVVTYVGDYSSGAEYHLAGIGKAPAYCIAIQRPGVADGFRAQWDEGAGYISSDPSGTITAGTRLEGLLTLSGAGVITGSQSLDAATATTGAASAARTLPSAWSEATLTVGAYNGGTLNTSAAFRSLRIASGVQTMDYMRAG